MATIRLIDESEASGPVRALFGEIKQVLQVPFVPQVFQALAVNPDHLASVWAQMKAVMMQGTLDLKTKALVALAIAAAGRCPYFVSAHTAALKRLGATDEELEDLMRVVEFSVGLNAYVKGLHLTTDLRG